MTVVVRNICRLLAIIFFLCCRAVASGQLSANFSATPSPSGCSPLIVNFTDASAGNPTNWKWDLGNGVTSLLKNPSATYFNPGSYTVKLVVSNASGADSVVKTNYITVFPNPVAGFGADKLTGCFPLKVNFTDASTPGTGAVVSWFWDFGDGNTSTEQYPSHVYTAVGNYTVTLRITNSSGCTNTFTRTQYISVSNGVKASFSNTDPGPCLAPATVNFTNTSTGPGPLTYIWKLGDGATSSATSPSHTYITNGTYSVELIAVSPQGCRDTMSRKDLLNIGHIQAQFSVPDTVCVNETITIRNTSIPAPKQSAWSFGNGTSSTQQHPTIAYPSEGLYTIKLVADFGGCKDSISKQVYVSPPIQPSFTASQRTFCTQPTTVQFTNTTPGAASVLWEFGDSTTSTETNPTHIYTAEGSYTVSLTATNITGCSVTATQLHYIQVQSPRVSLTGLPRTGCVPQTITPAAIVTSNHSISGYLWKFGDGATSTSPTPSHTYTKAGTYAVSLVYTTSTGCTDTITFQDAVRVGTKPSADFTVRPSEVCASQTVSFIDKSTGVADQWFWSFGDGGTSTQQNPVYKYSGIGWFDVQLIVSNNTCPDTILIRNAVHIKPPIASFSLVNTCTDKYTKTFTDQSVGATTWSWDFGDGTTSTERNPVHRFASAGIYQVKLTVSNDTCVNFYTEAVRVMDERAAFTSDTVVCRHQSATFVSSGIDSMNISSWQWDFGDGATANTPSTATHAYSIAGKYTVTLTVIDLFGCSNTISRTMTVFGPTAAFDISAPVSCFLNNKTTFTDRSSTDGTHPITKWQWNYGDGTIDSAGIAPYLHTYSTAGSYTVSLLVKDNFGCVDSVTAAAGILISQPEAGFQSADTITCTGKPIVFSNTSLGANLQSVWNFGDGNTSSIDHPVHHYAGIGTYSVKLVVTDQYGCKDSLTRPSYINISFPKARFKVSDSVSTCPPLLVNFSHQSTDYTSLDWDFGDGTASTLNSPSHFYTAAGIYNAMLIVHGPGGCIDTMVKKIEVKGPGGSLTYAPVAGCEPLVVGFRGTAKNNATFTWDFADGNIQVTPDSVVTHTYSNAGNYLPKMILTDASGCQVPITGTDTIRVSGVNAGFTMSAANLCSQGTIQFNNTTVSNDLITAYRWNFGDGSTTSARHPSHHYTIPGVYTVSLAVTTRQGCQDSISLTDTVKIYANPSITIRHDSSGCVPITVGLSGEVLQGDASRLQWAWDFANGNTDNKQFPLPQKYTTANAYPVIAIVTDDHGCRDTASTIISAYPIPAVDAGPDAAICRGSFAQLNASGAATYTWTTAASLSCTDCKSPLAAPADSTRYSVTGTSEHGCVASDSILITVHQPFTLQVGKGDTICAGSTVQLNASGTDLYTWTPATTIANPVRGITTANPMTSTLFTVIAKDKHNCFTDTGSVYIKVWPLPTVDAGPDKTINIGSRLVLEPKYSTDVISYRWTNPGQTLSCVDCATPTALPKTAQTAYQVQVMNEGGCIAKDDITILAICNSNNLFIPNTFSPNNDGKNDYFYPRGTGLSQIKSLRIYNRWGEVVFAATNITTNDQLAGWNGTYKGQDLAPDVYVYTCEVICGNNEVLTYNGNVTLLR
jgi:gliding motility-associated-like protein